MDDGTDPHPPTGRPPPRRPLFVLTTDGVVPLAVEEALDPRNWGSAEPSRQSPEASREQRRSRRHRHRRPSFPPPPPPSRSLPPVDDGAAVSSRGAEGYMPQAGARERRRLIRDVTSSVASSSSAPSCSHSDHPRTGTHVRQSVLYSNRPMRSRPKRRAPAEECTREESSSGLGNLPTTEELSLSDPLLLNPQIMSGNGCDGAEEHAIALSSCELRSPAMNLSTFEALSLSDRYIPETAEKIYDEMPGDVGQSVPYTYYPKGLSRSMVLSLGDSLFKTVSIKKQPKADSDVDIEEQLRLVEEYFAKRPKDFGQAVAEAKANERATLAALAAEWRTEEPRELPQQDSSVTARPQLSMSHRAPRCEASEENFQTGNEWMNKEVMLCFEKYVERSPDLTGLVDYKLDELQRQCFNVESYDKVFHHYNFTVRMKMPNSVDWTVKLYFAEAKEIFMRKYYVCYPLEPNENGCCYACKNQGVEDLRHPVIGVFEMGSRDSPACGLWYTDE